MQQPSETPDYRRMYLALFNRLTDVIAEIDRMNFYRAKELLMEAQQEGETIFLEDSPEMSQ